MSRIFPALITEQHLPHAIDCAVADHAGLPENVVSVSAMCKKDNCNARRSQTRPLEIFGRLILKVFLFAIISALASPTFAQSGKISEAYIGCLTAENLNQLYNAIEKGDKKLRDSMMGQVCILIKGYEYSLLDRGILKSKIRLYVGDTTIDLVVPSEAVK